MGMRPTDRGWGLGGTPRPSSMERVPGSQFLTRRAVQHIDSVDAFQGAGGRQNRRIADLDFQQGQQFQIAVFVGLQVSRVCRATLSGNIGEGLAVVVLHLPLAVSLGPIQHVVGVPQVIRVARAQLELDVGELAGREII